MRAFYGNAAFGRVLIKSHLIILLFLFLTISTAFAEQVTFIKEYTYQASEMDCKASSRTIALEQVKGLLMEELGSFLISKTEVKDFKLTKDQVTSMTSGIVMTVIIDEKWDGKTYYLKAKVTADPEEIAKSVDNIRNDKEKKEELEETRKKTEAALSEVNKLRKELQAVKADKNQQEAYTKAVSSLDANDWIDKGNAFMASGEYQNAIDAFNKALEVNPGMPRVYLLRGIANLKMDRNQQTIEDCSRALKINPRMPQAYLHRGIACLNSGKKYKAIRDFDDALKINAKMPRAYLYRGITYQELGRNRKAIADFDNAIEINPKMAQAYFYRGFAYKELGNKQKSIEDIKSAARLHFYKAQDYLRSQGID